MGELEKISWVDFMVGLHHAPHDKESTCVHGCAWGYVAVPCCQSANAECGCMGMPVDYEECPSCEQVPEGKIQEWCDAFNANVKIG